MPKTKMQFPTQYFCFGKVRKRDLEKSTTQENKLQTYFCRFIFCFGDPGLNMLAMSIWAW